MAGAHVRLVFGSCSGGVRVPVRMAFCARDIRARALRLGRDCVMEDRFQEILDDLPAATSRSRLEPYKELIREMRQRNYSFRKISQVLAEKCALRISHSIVHDFVHRHLHDSRSAQRHGKGREPVTQSACMTTKPARADRASVEPPRDEGIVERIAAIKRRVQTQRADSPAFQFDTSEPLRLKPRKT